MKQVSLAVALFFAAVTCTAAASEAPARATSSPVLNIQASAEAKAPMDEMVVVLAVERDGAALGSLNQTVLAETNKALAEARKQSNVSAWLGTVRTHPVWGPQGKPSGWSVRAEVVLESRDFKQLSQFAGELSQKMAISSLSFRLSKEKRAALEQSLLTEVAANFKQKAEAAATALGYTGYAVKEVSLNQSTPGMGQPMPMMLMKSNRAEAVAMPTDAGDESVSITMAGAVFLKR